MIFDGDGVLRGDGGAELARVTEAPGDPFAAIEAGGEEYEIVRPHALGWRFQVLDPASQLFYDFHPGLRRGGIIALAGGEPAAHINRRLSGRGWRIVPKGKEPTAVRRRRGLAGPVLSEGRLAAAELELSAPRGLAPEDPRLLAFACWLIAQWETQAPA